MSRPLSRSPHDDHSGGGDAHSFRVMSTTEAPSSGAAPSNPGGTGLVNCRKKRTSDLDADMPRFSHDLARLHLTTPPIPHSSLQTKRNGGSGNQRALRMSQDKCQCDTEAKRSSKHAAHLRKATPSNLSKHHLPPLVPSSKPKSMNVGVAAPKQTTTLPGET